MGHFGRRPIRVSWVYFVLPALMINDLGQGAMIMSLPPLEKMEVIQNPFFYLAGDAFRLPLVILATMATVIASQAVISGAFSVTQQARSEEHTSELQSLMRISYAVFCLKKKKNTYSDKQSIHDTKRT